MSIYYRNIFTAHGNFLLTFKRNHTIIKVKKGGVKMWLQALNEIKKKSGKTIEEISEMSGVPRGTLNKIFSGGTKDPKYSTLKQIVHCLGYTVDDLERIETKKSPEPEGTEDKVSMDELVNMLSKAGFLDKNGDLSDADLRFLMAVGEMIRTWFADRK